MEFARFQTSCCVHGHGVGGRWTKPSNRFIHLEGKVMGVEISMMGNEVKETDKGRTVSIFNAM